MRPDVLSGRSESINMQPLTGFGTSVDEHWKCRPSTSRRSQSARFGFLDAIGYTELVLMDAYVSD